MALWLTQSAGTTANAGADTASSGVTDVFPDFSSNTKGAWAQMIAATTYDSNCITFVDRRPIGESGQFRSRLYDIAIGGSGSERVVVPNLTAGWNASAVIHRVPIFVPAGSRISVRTQVGVNGGSLTGNVLLYLERSSALPILARAKDYGSNTGDSTATTLPGGTLAANTKSSWVELTSSTTSPIRYLYAQFSAPYSNDWGASEINGLVDIGVGGSGSEVVVMPNLQWRGRTDEIMIAPSFGAFIDIPAGSRIAARWQTNITNPTTANNCARVSVIGFG